MELGILGCGYTGVRLAEAATAGGHRVRAAVRSEASRQALRTRGLDARCVDLADGTGLDDFFRGLDGVVHLAPPPPAGELDFEVARIRRASDVSVFVYGSTTGAFGSVEGWIDERTPPGPLSPRGRARARYEAALRAAGLPVRVVRIAGIYGPGRTIKHALDRGLVLFEGGPPTSRVHVADLARILEAMLDESAPELVIACDEEPTPTLEVARYVVSLLAEPEPEVLDLDTARGRLSPAAIELRLGGRRCRSIHRADLIGELLYPTYREGMRAALIEDGFSIPSPK